MPKEVHQGLSTARVRNEKKPGRYADGNGLYLHVSETGARWWLWRGTVHGKRAEIGIGSARVYSLADAREIAREWRKIAREGGDPKAARDKSKRESITFEEAARKVWKLQTKGARSEKGRTQWLTSLEQHAFPRLASLPMHTIKQQHILEVLSPIWNDRAVTARRIKQRLNAIFDWAIASGHYDAANPVVGVDRALPKRRPKVRHFEAMPYEDVPDFMRRLGGRNIMSAHALRFLVLTATRSGELRNARWSEIDWSTSTWTIPPERTKMGKAHTVPLSAEALGVLTEVRGADAELVFPGQRRGKPLNDVTLADAVKAVGGQGTVHGFRTSFRTWAAEKTNFPREVAELCLAHEIGDAVERAYARTDLFEKRRKLMDAWGRYCVAEAGKVVRLPA